MEKPTKSIHEIRKQQQDEHSDMLKSLGIFFAFSDYQFESQKQEGFEYYSTGYGMQVPKHKLEDYKTKSREISEKYNKMYAQLIGLDKFIADTLDNQEAYYSGDLEETLEIVQATFPECTYDDVQKIYNKNVSKYT